MNDQAAILLLHDRWISIEQSGDSLGVLEFCRDDVVWLIPSMGAICGKLAVQAWLEQQPDVAIERIEISKLEVEVSGSLAVKRADFKTMIKHPVSSEIVEFWGAHLWTLNKNEEQGCWQVSNVCWSIKA